MHFPSFPSHCRAESTELWLSLAKAVRQKESSVNCDVCEFHEDQKPARNSLPLEAGGGTTTVGWVVGPPGAVTLGDSPRVCGTCSCPAWGDAARKSDTWICQVVYPRFFLKVNVMGNQSKPRGGDKRQKNGNLRTRKRFRLPLVNKSVFIFSQRYFYFTSLQFKLGWASTLRCVTPLIRREMENRD